MKERADMDKYKQLCVWPGTLMGENTPEQFEAFMQENFGVRAAFEVEVVTNASSERNEEGGRHDILFYVHEDDIGRFAVARLSAGIRWWEDAVKYNDGAYLYTEEVLQKYPATW